MKVLRRVLIGITIGAVSVAAAAATPARADDHAAGTDCAWEAAGSESFSAVARLGSGGKNGYSKKDTPAEEVKEIPAGQARGRQRRRRHDPGSRPRDHELVRRRERLVGPDRSADLRAE